MSVPTITNEELRDSIDQSLSGVFQTMIEFDCQAGSFEDLPATKQKVPDLGETAMDAAYVGSVGFVGAANGVVYLYLKNRFLEKAAAKITGLGGEDLDSEIIMDVCGELTNMFGGSFKTCLLKLGYDSTLTIPTVLSGEELFVSTINVKRHLRVNFKSNGDEVVADLVLADGASA